MSRPLSASRYYFSSFVTLLTRTSFWKIPFVPITKPMLFSLWGQGNFYVDNLMDVWVLKEVIIDKQYELLYGSPLNNWTVVDVGSGIGDMAVMLSGKVKKFYGFDPDENRFALSLKNIKHNKSKNVTLKKEAVTRLDDIFKEYKITTCDLLKVDCEGAEYPIFANSTDAALKKVKRIVMEAHLFTPKMKKEFPKLKKRLRKSGFAFVEQDNQVHDYIRYFYASR